MTIEQQILTLLVSSIEDTRVLSQVEEDHGGN
jgi:hypothetical protein